jgi:AcrR family transcriptional regulator
MKTSEPQPRASRTGDRTRATEAAEAPTTGRLTSEERREALIDVAFELLRDGGAENVTMGRIAEHADVTRALVYKHFANRNDVLAAVYRREAARLDAEMVADVMSVKGFEARLRRFARGVLHSVDTHGWIFVPLQAQSMERSQRHEQRERDRRTVRGFAALAMREFGLSRADATMAIAVLLSGVSSLRSQAHARPSAAERQRLEDLYVDLVMGALRSLAEKRADE